jgi:broad specificity phosphatase PhoE
MVRILLAYLMGAPLDRFQRTVVDTASVSVAHVGRGGDVRVLLVNGDEGLARFGPNGSPPPWERSRAGSRGTENLRG